MSLGCLGSGCLEKDKQQQPSQSSTRLGLKQGSTHNLAAGLILKKKLRYSSLAGTFAFQVTQTPRSSTQRLAIPSPNEERASLALSRWLRPSPHGVDLHAPHASLLPL